MNCENCIHYKACLPFYENIKMKLCDMFEDKDLYIKLPCKINDHVWFIKSAFSVLVKPLEARIIAIRGISIDRIILFGAITLYNDLSRSFTSNDIGTKVFLTKEEAEKAIQALKGGNE